MIAIHYSEYDKYCNYWIDYCEKNNIPYKKVDCLSSNIVSDLKDCKGLMWHRYHGNFTHHQIARELLNVIEFYTDIKLFPDFLTSWHFDDKISQTLLLDEISAPIPKYWITYKKKEALEIIKEIEYPVVFKLKSGAGSTNVRLLSNQKEAKKIVRKMFSRGINPTQSFILPYIKSTIKKKRLKPNNKVENQINSRKISLKNIPKLIKEVKEYKFRNSFPNEKGYIYLQEYIKGCNCDYRVIIIGDFAYVFQRMNRKNDFRASGSGNFKTDQKDFYKDLVKIGFQVADKIKTQCIALDLLKSARDYFIVEISYGFIDWKWDSYWNRHLELIEKPLDPIELMLQNFLEEINNN